MNRPATFAAVLAVALLRPNDAAARQSMDDLKGYVRRHLQGG